MILSTGEIEKRAYHQDINFRYIVSINLPTSRVEMLCSVL